MRMISFYYKHPSIYFSLILTKLLLSGMLRYTIKQIVGFILPHLDINIHVLVVTII